MAPHSPLEPIVRASVSRGRQPVNNRELKQGQHIPGIPDIPDIPD